MTDPEPQPTPEPDPPEPDPPEPDPAEALHRVVEGPEPDPESIDWAADQLLSGRTFPALVAELTDQGWDPAEAEAAVEAARVLTRSQRGVITRDDVTGDLDARYRRSTTGLSTFYRSGSLLGALAFVGGLRSALTAAQRLRRIARQRDDWAG